MSYFTKFCNICFSADNNTDNIQETTEIIKFRESIDLCFPNIDIPKDISVYLCSKCNRQSKTFYKFLEKCKKNLPVLSKLLQISKTQKFETCLETILNAIVSGFEGNNASSSQTEATQIEKVEETDVENENVKKRKKSKRKRNNLHETSEEAFMENDVEVEESDRKKKRKHKNKTKEDTEVSELVEDNPDVDKLEELSAEERKVDNEQHKLKESICETEHGKVFDKTKEKRNDSEVRKNEIDKNNFTAAIERETMNTENRLKKNKNNNIRLAIYDLKNEMYRSRRQQEEELKRKERNQLSGNLKLNFVGANLDKIPGYGAQL